MLTLVYWNSDLLIACTLSIISTSINILNQMFPSSRFIRVGGYRLLNSWLTYSKTTNNTPLLQLILLTLQKLPLKVDHLKQVLSQFIRENTPPVCIRVTVPSNLHLMLLSFTRTTQPSWWSSWARVQRLRVSWIVHQKSKPFLFFRQQHVPNWNSCLFLLDLRKLASVLVDGWMAIIRSQSVSSSSNSPAGTDRLFPSLNVCVYCTTPPLCNSL